MVKVYFESDSTSDLTMTFQYEEDFNTLLGVLEVMCKERGYDRVQEVVTEDSLHD